MESPAVLQKEESKKSQSKEGEKKDDAKQPEEVTTLKSLNMDDVHKKTQTASVSTPWMHGLARMDSPLMLRIKNEVENAF